MDLGIPEEHPHIVIEPLRDPIPREDPQPAPREPKLPVREPDLVPA